MTPQEASQKWQQQQARTLWKSYRAGWDTGQQNYRSEKATPPATTAAVPPPSSPPAQAMLRALGPALVSLANMGVAIATIVPTAEMIAAAGGSLPAALVVAITDYLASNAYRLAGGASAAWAGEQHGYVQAAAADGLLLDWELDAGAANHCFPAGTFVATPTGDRSIETITDGDEVLTHAGVRRVTAAHATQWHGRMWSVRADGREVQCTPNHPFLAKREGELAWVRADALTQGDTVFLHDASNRRGVGLGESQHVEATISQVGIAARVPLRVAVPVLAVNLHHQALSDQEVRGVLADGNLLAERDASLLKRFACGSLRGRLSGVAPPAGTVTEAVVNSPVRLHAKLFAAGGARHMNGWAEARLRAVLRIPRVPKRLAATLTDVLRCALARLRGCARVGLARLPWSSTPAGHAAVRLNLAGAPYHALAAGGAGRLDGGSSSETLAAPRAVLPWRRGEGQHERLTADRAGPLAGWFAVQLADTLDRAVQPLATVAGLPIERLSTPQTGPIHPGIFVDEADVMTVYNLTVEGDHSYVAGGFVVHNCNDCPALAGLPPMALDQWPTLPGDGLTECSVACFAPGTLVEGCVEGGLRAVYDGPMVELETARGHRLTLTANHPVATPQGFVPAGSLSEGGYVVSDRREVGQRTNAGSIAVAVVDGQDQQDPTVVEQVFEACQEWGAARRRQVRLDPVDLYGDARFLQGDVDVVWTHSALLDDRPGPAFGEHVGQFVFPSAPPAASHLSSRGNAFPFLGGLDAAACRSVSRRHLLFDTSLSLDLNPPMTGGLTARSQNDTGGSQLLASAPDAPPVGVTRRAKRTTGVRIAERCECSRRRSGQLARGIPRRAELPLDQSGIVSNPLPFEMLRFGLASRLDASLSKPAGQDRAADAALLAELQDGRSGLVAPDQIVKVRHFHSRGHVYDLQSPNGWLLADGILAANCKCSMRAVATAPTPLTAEQHDVISRIGNVQPALIAA